LLNWGLLVVLLLLVCSLLSRILLLLIHFFLVLSLIIFLCIFGFLWDDLACHGAFLLRIMHVSV